MRQVFWGAPSEDWTRLRRTDGRGVVDRKQRGLVLKGTEKPGEKGKATRRKDWGAPPAALGGLGPAIVGVMKRCPVVGEGR